MAAQLNINTSQQRPSTSRKKLKSNVFSRIGKSCSENILPFVQIGYENERHLVPERFPIALKKRPVSARLIDLNRLTLTGVENVSSTLTILDVSCLALKKIPDDMISNLSRLQRLDISYNLIDDEGIPENFRELGELIELRADHNKLTKLPKNILASKKLKRLKLNNNRLQSITEIDKLSKLIQLDIDHNQLDNLPPEIYQLRKLEYLHISSNGLKSLSNLVKNFKELKFIDLSNNQLISIPIEIFALNYLKYFNANRNRIVRVRQLKNAGLKKRLIDTIDLSYNKLQSFPESLLKICKKIDLTSNEIRIIPNNSLKKLNYNSGQVLLLDDNPLISPSADVASCGLRGLVQFYYERKNQMVVHKGLKVYVIGPSSSGKTSFVQSFIDRTSRLANTTSTEGVVVSGLSLPFLGDDLKSLPITIFDFSGNFNSLFTHQYFLHEPSLIILTYDLTLYDEDDDDNYFQSKLQPWLDYIVCKTNKLSVIALATNTDKTSKKKTLEIRAMVEERLNRYVKERIAGIEEHLKKIESRRHIPQSLRGQRQKLIDFLQFPYKFSTAAVSSLTMSGYEEFNNVLMRRLLDVDFYPTVGRVISSLWMEIEYYIEEKADNMRLPLMSFCDYETEICEKFGMRHLIVDITRYLHDTGKVLWFSDDPFLSDYIILRVNWLDDVLNAIFLHGENLQYDSLSSLSSVKSPLNNIMGGEKRFETLKNQFVCQAIASKDYVKVLIGDYIDEFNYKNNNTNSSSSSSLNLVLYVLVEKFGIGFCVKDDDSLSKSMERSGTKRLLGNKKDKGNNNIISTSEKTRNETTTNNGDKDDDKSTTTILNVNKFRIPWLIKTKIDLPTPPEIRITIVFHFTYYTPPIIFSQLLIKVHQERNHLKLIALGSDSMLARSELKDGVQLQISNLQHGLGSCINFTVGYDGGDCEKGDGGGGGGSSKNKNKGGGGDGEGDGDDDDDKDVVEVVDYEILTDLWSVLLPLLKDMDVLINQYKGLFVERFTACKNCKKFTFLGEWNNPKELQDMKCKTCNNCKVDIPTGFLVQPKERNYVDELLKNLKVDEIIDDGEDIDYY